jgi:secondary thiamine-phosphate synthase enzyme
MLKTINLRTKSHTDFIDITGLINQTISESKVDSGICTVYVPHTTAGVFINENADPDVVYDVKKIILKNLFHG